MEREKPPKIDRTHNPFALIGIGKLPSFGSPELDKAARELRDAFLSASTLEEYIKKKKEP